MTSYHSRRRPRLLVGVAIVVALLVGAGVGAFAYRTVGHTSPGNAGRLHGGSTSPDGPPGSSGSSGTSGTKASSTTVPAPLPLSVVSMSPPAGSRLTVASTPITIKFSSPLASTSPPPRISPQLAGSWHQSGSTITFSPSTGYLPSSEITVSLPGGPTGIEASDGGHLSESSSERLSVASGSVFRLQQLLSLLDYSPLRWTPSGPPVAPSNAEALAAALYKAPDGTFSWRQAGWPAQLRAMWQPGVENTFTTGLVMSFQADHGLTPNGEITPSLWSSLDSALAKGQLNTGGYNYALADKSGAESLTLYHNGAVVLRSPANTGIADSPTPDGTFPVFSRLRTQVMRGSNPDGSHYADLVQYIAYFHDNDAVHYMPRADYGIPQSLGCIELPLADASRAWSYLAYGTLVTVIN